MPGMNSGLNISDPAVVAAFKAALVHQGLIALLIFGLLGLAWITIRAGLPAAAAAGPARRRRRRRLPLPSRPGGGCCASGSACCGSSTGSCRPSRRWRSGSRRRSSSRPRRASPGWVQHLVNWAGTTWSYHPMQAGASAVWIQVGIGIWLIVAARGPLSRLAGLVSVGWGLVVWVFGEAFGGIFAPGLTWLFGAPGAVLIYAVAGALIALPERAWRSRRLGRLLTAGTGAFLLGMAVLQAWPGRGFWQGISHGQPGTLAGMTSTMAQTPQPGFLSAWVNAFTAFDEAHGFAVNLFVVAALAVTGAAFLSGRPRLIRPVLIGFTVLCLADWVLIEDLGFLGGLGTDPNSMIPMVLLAAAGYLAAGPGPRPGSRGRTGQQPGGRGQLAGPAPDRRRAADAGLGEHRLRRRRSARSASSSWARRRWPPPRPARSPTPSWRRPSTAPAPRWTPPPRAFSLTDQHGRDVTLASLRGKVVLLTFLDPVCTTDCPLEAQEFRQAGQLLGADDRRVELVAIVANPVDYQLGYTQAFDRQEGLDGVPNWLYLTGSPAQLAQVWRGYGIAAEIAPAGSMIAHSEIAYVIDSSGRLRQEMDFDPGPGTAATQSSFAAELTDAARQLLRQS